MDAEWSERSVSRRSWWEPVVSLSLRGGRADLRSALRRDPAGGRPSPLQDRPLEPSRAHSCTFHGRAAATVFTLSAGGGRPDSGGCEAAGAAEGHGALAGWLISPRSSGLKLFKSFKSLLKNEDHRGLRGVSEGLAAVQVSDGGRGSVCGAVLSVYLVLKRSKLCTYSTSESPPCVHPVSTRVPLCPPCVPPCLSRSCGYEVFTWHEGTQPGPRPSLHRGFKVVSNNVM